MITDMHDLNGALFLKVSCLPLMLCALVRLKIILSFTRKYASL